MSEVLHLRGLGATLDVRCTGSRSAELASAMRDAWSRCLDDVGGARAGRPTEGVRHAGDLEVRLDDDTDLALCLMLATQRITHSFITAHIGRLLMFHAGAVSHPVTGDAIVYVAASGTGKTTLSRHIGCRFGYVTDETVGIDEGLRILPYPKPLSIRPSHASPPGEGAPTPVKDEVSPDRLGLLKAPADVHVARVVLLDRHPGAQSIRVQLEELPFMDAVFALAEQTSSLAALDRPLQRLGALIDEVGPVIRVRYSEAAEIEDVLMGLAGGVA